MFDDYKWNHCPGVEKAIHEFMIIHNDFDIRVFDNTYNHPFDNTSINECFREDDILIHLRNMRMGSIVLTFPIGSDPYIKYSLSDLSES